MEIIATIVFIFSGLLFILGILNLFNKGFLLNNAYLYANKKEKEEMEKRPYYKQSGTVFIMLGVAFIFEGFNVLFRNNLFFILLLVTMGIALIFAVISTIFIEKNKNKTNK